MPQELGASSTMFGYLSSATEWMQRKAVHLLLRKKLGEFFEDQFDLDQIQVQLRQHEQHGDLTWQAAVSHVKVSTAAIAKHLVRALSAPLYQPSSHQLYLLTCQMYMVTQLARPGWLVQPQSASTLVSFYQRQLSTALAFLQALDTGGGVTAWDRREALAKFFSSSSRRQRQWGQLSSCLSRHCGCLHNTSLCYRCVPWCSFAPFAVSPKKLLRLGNCVSLRQCCMLHLRTYKVHYLRAAPGGSAMELASKEQSRKTICCAGLARVAGDQRAGGKGRGVHSPGCADLLTAPHGRRNTRVPSAARPSEWTASWRCTSWRCSQKSFRYSGKGCWRCGCAAPALCSVR